MERCIRAIFSSDAAPEALADFVKAVHHETSKSGLAPINAFVLVEWCSILLQEISGTGHWEKWGLETVLSNAQALELCLGESSRSNVKHSALVVTRRGLRKVFSKADTRERVIGEAVQKLTAKGSHSTAGNAVILGVIGGVCARLPDAKQILLTKKPDFYAFYNREIIGSRTPVPAHIASALGDFFVDFATIEDLQKEIVPSLEKALLRAPEIVLNELVTPLFESLSKFIDLSSILRSNLLKPLLSNVKSTNVAIRHGALSAFKAAALSCREMKIVFQIAEEILTPLRSGKLSSTEQRTCHAEMLAVLPVSNATVELVAPSLSAVASKEANEAALTAETLALLHYVVWAVQNGTDLDKPVIDSIVKGLLDKKIPVRKLWTIRLGEMFLSTADADTLASRLDGLAEASMPALLEVWNDATSNPIAAAQSGLVTAAYVFTTIARSQFPLLSNPKVDAALKKAQIARQALTVEPKPSFLLNPRVYGKLSGDDDVRWFILALSALSEDVAGLDPDSAIAVGWSQAVIFSICSSSIRSTLRRDASQSLSRSYVRNPEAISRVIVAGLWHWIQAFESGDKESAAAAAKTDTQNLHLVVKSITLVSAEISRLNGQIRQTTRQGQMLELLVLSRPELIPRLHWIDLCLRVEVDPGVLAREYEDALLQSILDLTSFNEKVSLI